MTPPYTPLPLKKGGGAIHTMEKPKLSKNKNFLQNLKLHFAPLLLALFTEKAEVNQQIAHQSYTSTEAQ